LSLKSRFLWLTFIFKSDKLCFISSVCYSFFNFSFFNFNSCSKPWNSSSSFNCASNLAFSFWSLDLIFLFSILFLCFWSAISIWVVIESLCNISFWWNFSWSCFCFVSIVSSNYWVLSFEFDFFFFDF
jgi:hypothetical protein